MYPGSYKFRSDNTLIVIGMCIILGNTTVFLVEERWVAKFYGYFDISNISISMSYSYKFVCDISNNVNINTECASFWYESHQHCHFC